MVSPQEIDEKLTSKEGNLNDLEAEVTVELISSLTETPYAIYLDSPDPVAKRYSDKVVKLLSSRGLSNVIVIAENGADKRYPIVSAASIVAKVIRDKEVEELKKLYGDFGSGYPSDPKTLRFLRDCLRKGYLPPIVRRSWSTLRRFGA
ncbi:MAG: ribonuclease HII [Thermofilum sp. ex4484_15]|nr:MAG: ribonuclease HII [Thermofilum sp. ex4484_15]